MTVKYVGPKPIISHRAIDFDTNKEDKYVYINIALQILHALEIDDISDKKHIFNTKTERLSDKQMTEQLKKYCKNFSQRTKDMVAKITKKLDNELEHIKNNTILNDEEKEVFINNHNLMRDYQIQRAVNKDIYYCIIERLAVLVKKDHLDYIVAPMFQKFAHVFHSIQGMLEKNKTPIDTDLEIYEEHGELLVKLQVKNTQ